MAGRGGRQAGRQGRQGVAGRRAGRGGRARWGQAGGSAGSGRNMMWADAAGCGATQVHLHPASCWPPCCHSTAPPHPAPPLPPPSTHLHVLAAAQPLQGEVVALQRLHHRVVHPHLADLAVLVLGEGEGHGAPRLLNLVQRLRGGGRGAGGQRQQQGRPSQRQPQHLNQVASSEAGGCTEPAAWDASDSLPHFRS